MIIQEGSAKITSDKNTFYNPKMKGLRDLSVLFLKARGVKKYSLLDSTGASGIRGIRYKLEASAGEVTILDINKKAYLNCKSNVAKSKINARVLNKSIQEFCNQDDESFDVIDLDPFGTAAPYIYDLMKVAKDGTLLMVTATDTAVLCGSNMGACMKTYSSIALHNELCHEGSVRILINYVARIAAQFNFGIEVKLSIANLHYVRIFLELKHGADFALHSVKKSGSGGFCHKCRNFSYVKGIVPKLELICNNCKAKLEPFGPMWLDSLYDKEILGKMMLEVPKGMDGKALGILLTIVEELDLPFFYSIPRITQSLGIGAVSREKVMETLRKKHAVSRTHFDPDGIKTDANIKEVILAVKKAIK